MSKKLKKPKKTKKKVSDRDNIDRLETIAFWLWEYTRRNASYRRRVNVIYRIWDRFEEIGELDNLLELTLHDFVDDLKDEQEVDLTENWFTERLEDYGEEYLRYYYKYIIISGSFARSFGRVLKDYDEGIDTEEVLELLLKGEEFSFRSSDKYDQYAVMWLRDKWVLSINGKSPTFFNSMLDDGDQIDSDPKQMVTHADDFAEELNGLNICKQLFENILSEEEIDYETKQQVYEFGGQGLNIDPNGDVMRLVVLWLWDKIHEGIERGDQPKSFDEIYPLLKERLREGYLVNVSYDSLFKRGRIRNYYEVTKYCIENLTVLPLNFKLKQ
ncbi:hypothetical protein [Maridesulfovibrio bastinii]|uniref:hypothetical protein n=1 Tax=Maridesulfovibrio bastinii TaxID=47157 RepID=UPI00040C0B35|nr:hypothetical protein [Maridesulfovibrio bastinii]